MIYYGHLKKSGVYPLFDSPPDRGKGEFVGVITPDFIRYCVHKGTSADHDDRMQSQLRMS